MSETYVIIEGIDAHKCRKQVLVAKEEFENDNSDTSLYFASPKTFIVPPVVKGEVEIEGETDILDSVYEAQ